MFKKEIITPGIRFNSEKNDQKRVDGYNIFHKTINYGLEKNVSHYFFGNNEHVVQSMINKLNNLYPGINIAGFYCPPLTETDPPTFLLIPLVYISSCQ